jgi:peptide/nickel transport system ATP-binding protein
MQVLKPTGGTIEFSGKDKKPVQLVDGEKDELRGIWRDIRMVFQDPQSSLNPRLRVLEIVGQCLRKAENLKGQELADRVSVLLEQVGLRKEFLLRFPNAFSGGQRQRLGIARALATNPELIIADEAVSALDVSIQAQTLNLLQDLQEEFDLTYVFIAHDLAVVEHICDRVAVMYLGQIVELATTDELFADPKHPYTRALLSAVPVPDPRTRSRERVPVGLSDGATFETGCRFASRCPHATDLCRAETPPRKRINGADVLCHFAGEV